MTLRTLQGERSGQGLPVVLPGAPFSFLRGLLLCPGFLALTVVPPIYPVSLTPRTGRKPSLSGPTALLLPALGLDHEAGARRGTSSPPALVVHRQLPAPPVDHFLRVRELLELPGSPHPEEPGSAMIPRGWMETRDIWIGLGLT